MTKAFSILEKDPNQAYLECGKVEKLLVVIQSSDVEVVAQKSVIASQFPSSFMGACTYFSEQVSHLHGGAQLESCNYKNCNVSAMYGHGDRGSRCDSGCRCFGGHGRFRGHGGGSHSGGHGRCGSSNSTMINGMDVLDPTHTFMEEEREQLTWNGGHQYVTQAHERINGHGGGGSQ